MGLGDQRHASADLPPGKTRYPLYRRLGGPQGRSVWVRKISPPPGSDPRTVQSVASCYTDWAIAAHKVFKVEKQQWVVFCIAIKLQNILYCLLTMICVTHFECVCLYSGLSYPACNAHASYCHLLACRAVHCLSTLFHKLQDLWK